MARIGIPKTREEKRTRRHLRVRKKVTGTPERPRLVVYRSLKHIYAQLVDDVAQRTIATVSSRTVAEGQEDGEGRGGGEGARGAGEGRRDHAVVFDRAGYKYHGRVKAVADGAREGGLEF